MTEAAQKFEVVDDRPVQTPTRFGTPDLVDKGIWIARRVRDKYPHLQDRWIVNWLGGLTAMNEYYFIHTRNAVLLAQRITEDLNPLPSVKVWFALCRDPKDKDQIADCCDLYRAAAKWASDIGALRMIDIDVLTDVPRPDIQQALGSRLVVQETIYAKIRK